MRIDFLYFAHLETFIQDSFWIVTVEKFLLSNFLGSHIPPFGHLLLHIHYKMWPKSGVWDQRILEDPYSPPNWCPLTVLLSMVYYYNILRRGECVERTLPLQKRSFDSRVSVFKTKNLKEIHWKYFSQKSLQSKGAYSRGHVTL